MADDLAPSILCAVCGRPMQPRDIVILSREVPPAWVSAEARPTIAVAHEGCELHGGRADYNWTRESPQTLSHALRTLYDGRDTQDERSPSLDRLAHTIPLR